MADGSSGTGILGVIVGVMLVVFIGAAILMATGNRLGGSSNTFSIKMPGTK